MSPANELIRLRPKGEIMKLNSTFSHKKIALLTLTLCCLTNCSPESFNSKTASSTNEDSQEANHNTDNGTIAVPDKKTSADRKKEILEILKKTNLSGFIANGPAKNITTPALDFNKERGEFSIGIPMSNFSNLVNFEMEIKNYPGMRIISDNSADNPLIKLIIPVKYVLQNVSEVPAKLPNGNRIPFFPSGEPPSKGFLLTPDKEEKLYLYLSAEAIGFYAETKFDPVINFGSIQINELVFSIKNKENTKIMGYLTFLGKKNVTNGGFFMSYRLDPQLSKLLEEYYLY